MPAPPWQTPPFHSEKCSTHNGKPAPIPYTQKQRASASPKRATRNKYTSAVHTKTAGVCPLFCCRKYRHDDAFVMFGRKSAQPSATHLCRDVSQKIAVCHTLMQGRIPKASPALSRHILMQGRIPKPALRLAAVTYAGMYPKDSRPLRTWRGRSPCALGGWRRS